LVSYSVTGIAADLSGTVSIAALCSGNPLLRESYSICALL